MTTTNKHYNIHERCVAEVDLSAIRANLLELRKCHEQHAAQQGGQKKQPLVFASVKANAYGHGVEQVARAIEDVTDYFGAAAISEALDLRAFGITKPILILGSLFTEDYEAAVAEELTLNIFEYENAKELNRAAAEQGKKAHIHISVDTGMSRVGLRPDAEGLETVKAITALPNLSVDGIFMHFATADETDKTPAEAALRKFETFRNMCDEAGIVIPIWHCANTAAVIEGVASGKEMDMVRCGIGIYGLYPSDEVIQSNVKLIPALTWYAHLTYIKQISAGTSVSYGYRFTSDREMTIGTVCCGYADGYPRKLSNVGEVIIGGKRCRILGSICMDQFMVDLTDVPEAKAGDKVILLGRDGDAVITAEEIAAQCGTINYEIICGIGARTERKYL